MAQETDQQHGVVSAPGSREAPAERTERRNIFVLGLDEFNLRYLETVRHAERYAFHELLNQQEIVDGPQFEIEGLLKKADMLLDRFDGSIDGIVSYWDFPSTMMASMIRRHAGLPGPSLESVLRCEHKYWSRRVQSEVAAEHVPRFALVDPFGDARAAVHDLGFPFWIKPVKAYSSRLGFRIRNQAEFDHALERIRAGIGFFADPLDAIMRHADVPAAIAPGHGATCIAEAMISHGRQCTLEGYVFEGEPHVYGVVDSVRGPNRSSFTRYEYPSHLPREIQRRMIDIAYRVIAHTGLDDSPFNMEFYWDKPHDRLWLLEINARLSKSHFPLFEKVEGVAHAEVMVDVALGRRPEYPLREGRYRHAAKFMPRIYGASDDSIVTRAPDVSQVRAIEAAVPGVVIELEVRSGMRLGEIVERDSYSHELAVIFVGANSRSALARKYIDVVDRLTFEIDGERWSPR